MVSVVFMFGLLCMAVSSTAGNNIIGQRRLGVSNMVSVGSNFGLADPSLKERGWASVNLYEGIVETITPSCQTKKMPWDSLSVVDSSLISNVVNQLNNIENYQTHYKDYYYQLIQFAAEAPLINYNHVNKPLGGSLIAHDAHDFTVAGDKLPYNMQRIFFSNDLVTFVFKNSTVSMKPLTCASKEEQELVKRLADEIGCVDDRKNRKQPSNIQQEMQGNQPQDLLDQASDSQKNSNENTRWKPRGQQAMAQENEVEERQAKIDELQEQIRQLLELQKHQLVE